MDELLEQASEHLGVPVDLLSRAAQARATADGVAVEAILARWLGVEGEVPPAAAEPSPAPAEPAAATPAPAEEAEPAGPTVEVLEPVAPLAAADEGETEGEAEPEPEPAPEPAGVAGRYPVWLTAMFVVVPLIAVLYLITVPNGPRCGSAGQLAVDPVTQEAVGCDGNAYGESAVNNFTLGQALYEVSCASCHAPDGSGGTGPALTGGSVLATFPAGQCAPHVQWVSLGSLGWQAEVGSTYGAPEKPVAGGMPSFDASLDEEEIARVVLYERVAFGEQALADAEADCGLSGEDGGDGEVAVEA